MEEEGGEKQEVDRQERRNGKDDKTRQRERLLLSKSGWKIRVVAYIDG